MQSTSRRSRLVNITSPVKLPKISTLASQSTIHHGGLASAADPETKLTEYGNQKRVGWLHCKGERRPQSTFSTSPAIFEVEAHYLSFRLNLRFSGESGLRLAIIYTWV